MRMFEHTNSVPRDNDAQTRGRTLNIYDGKHSWAQTHVSIDSMKIDVLTQNGDTGYYPLTKACRKLTNIYSERPENYTAMTHGIQICDHKLDKKDECDKHPYSILNVNDTQNKLQTLNIFSTNINYE